MHEYTFEEFIEFSQKDYDHIKQEWSDELNRLKKRFGTELRYNLLQTLTHISNGKPTVERTDGYYLTIREVDDERDKDVTPYHCYDFMLIRQKNDFNEWFPLIPVGYSSSETLCTHIITAYPFDSVKVWKLPDLLGEALWSLVLFTRYQIVSLSCKHSIRLTARSEGLFVETQIRKNDRKVTAIRSNWNIYELYLPSTVIMGVELQYRKFNFGKITIPVEDLIWLLGINDYNTFRAYPSS